MMELINGYWGQDHVTSYQEAAIQAGILGANNCVLGYVGQAMMAEAVTANKVRIHDGVHVAYGKAIIINKDEYEDVEIENGTAGMLRNDMIIIRYTKDETTGVEKVVFDVLQGQSGSTAVDPTPNTQDMYDEGVLESEIPFARVSLNGLAITSVTPLYDTVPSIAQINSNLSNKCSGFGCVTTSQSTVTPSVSPAIKGYIKEWDHITGLDSAQGTFVAPKDGVYVINVNASFNQIKDAQYSIGFYIATSGFGNFHFMQSDISTTDVQGQLSCSMHVGLLAGAIVMPVLTNGNSLVEKIAYSRFTGYYLESL